MDEQDLEDLLKSAGSTAKTEAETRCIAGQTVRKYDRLKCDLWLDQDFQVGPMFEEESETGRTETLDESTRATGCSHTTPTRADWLTQQPDEETQNLIKPVENVADNAVNPENLDDTPTQQTEDQQRYTQRSCKATQRFGIDD